MGIRKRAHVTEEELSLLIDGRLEDGVRRRVEAHVETCPTCRESYETLQQTVLLLQKTPRVSLPRVFTLTEADVARFTHRRRSGKMLWLRWATALVAAMLIAVVGLDFTLARLESSPPALVPQPKIALRAQSLTPAPAAPPAAVTTSAPSARLLAPEAPARARRGPSRTLPAETTTPALKKSLTPAVKQVPLVGIGVSPTATASGGQPWPWYRWAEFTLAGLLLVLLVLLVVLK